MSVLKANYQGVEITYDERENKWVFEVRGRERSAESLAKAKESIDRPEPKEKTFTRMPAWRKEYSEGWQVVEITSIAEKRYGSQYAWISQNKHREKVRVDELYVKSPKNDELVAKWNTLQSQIEDARKAQYELELEQIELPE